jgi:hypothetical protein
MEKLKLPEELPGDLHELQGILEKILDYYQKPDTSIQERAHMKILYGVAALKYNAIAGRLVMFTTIQSAIAAIRYRKEKLN